MEKAHELCAPANRKSEVQGEEPMSDNLPVEAVLREALRRTYSRKAAIVRLCWPYAVLLTVLTLVPSEDDTGLTVFISILLALTGVLAAVSCHQIFLLTPEEVAQIKPTRWGSSEWKFLGRSIVLGILTSFMAMPVFGLVFGLSGVESSFFVEHEVLSGLLQMLILAPIYYFAARWSLILPDAALDGERNITWAWDVTKGNGLQLFVLIGAVPLAVNLVSVVLLGFFEWGIVLVLLSNLLWIVAAPVEICLLSLSYQWILDYACDDAQTE